MINDELNIFRGIFKAPLLITILLLEVTMQACLLPFPLHCWHQMERQRRARPDSPRASAWLAVCNHGVALSLHASHPTGQWTYGKPEDC